MIAAAHWTVCLLAGGRSRRMGRDKATISVNGRTLLQRVRSTAMRLGFPIKTIRKDAVPNCGPLSGVYTGLTRSRPGWCLFLTCDMPLVSERTLREVVRMAFTTNAAVAIRSEHGWGFPLAIPTDRAATVLDQLNAEIRSLQSLADVLNARPLKVPKNREQELLNVNTPTDLESLLAWCADGTNAD